MHLIMHNIYKKLRQQYLLCQARRACNMVENGQIENKQPRHGVEYDYLSECVLALKIRTRLNSIAAFSSQN